MASYFIIKKKLLKAFSNKWSDLLINLLLLLQLLKELVKFQLIMKISYYY